MTSNTLRFNFYPCYERFCRKCIDGTCTDEETYKNCEFGADKVMERARKRAVTNCVNCGAPLHGNVCEYCGTEYNLRQVNDDFSKDIHEDVDVWTDCNGVIHRASRKEILQEFNKNPW